MHRKCTESSITTRLFSNTARQAVYTVEAVQFTVHFINRCYTYHRDDKLTLKNIFWRGLWLMPQREIAETTTKERSDRDV
ncbi:MAG: hypothetical protein FWH17_07505 [Oscillospiraceae bacterium]|nr:hypothetical protein [Oscillospiraceae bacterium]